MDFDIDISSLPTPSYIVDERLLIKNLEKLKSIIDRTGCRILLAQKGFSMFYFYPLIKKYLNGTTASSLYEARLGFEEMGNETHIFNPSYREDEIDEILSMVDHIVFNSFNQWSKYKNIVKSHERTISCGLRVNPEYSSVETEIYNPTGKFSRFGVTRVNFKEDELDGIDGLHFHALCEQNSDALEATLVAFEEKFGQYLHGMKWVNFGGGHHITRVDYDVEGLIKLLKDFKSRYPHLKVYLEPGEAIGWQTGYLVGTVLDVINNGMDLVILDTSAEAHMPDTLAMPYRAMIRNSGVAGEKKHTYRLGGNTCLAGDIIGDYSFDKPLEVGDKVIFEDMIHYTMVKTTTFNGIKLPSIVIKHDEKNYEIVKNFGYNDYKMRLS